VAAVGEQPDVKTKYQGYQKHYGNIAFSVYATEGYELHMRNSGVQKKQSGEYKHRLL
jgi:hypothetical protein